MNDSVMGKTAFKYKKKKKKKSEQGSIVLPQPLEQPAEDVRADSWLAVGTEGGGLSELVIDTKGRYPAVIKPWVIWQSSVWSDYHAMQHKGVPPALRLISSLRVLIREGRGPWEGQTLGQKSAD